MCIQKTLRTASLKTGNESLARMFQISVTHYEVQEGLLRLSNQARNAKTFFFRRDFASRPAEDAIAGLYFDLSAGQLNAESKALNEQLKNQVRVVVLETLCS